jgi:hypothetical protein
VTDPDPQPAHHDDYAFFRRVNLKPAGLVLTKLIVKRWGSELVVELDYEPWGDNRHFHLEFHQCRDTQWHVFGEQGYDDFDQLDLEILGFDIGEADYQRRAVILTVDIVEILVWYKTLDIQEVTSFDKSSASL